MITGEVVSELVEKYIEGKGIFLVDVHVKPGNAIRVFVDRQEGVSLDDCVEISRFLNVQLDRNVEDYSLEVSSPGLGSPFRVKQQYEKNAGRKIEVALKDGFRLTGTLESVSERTIVIRAGNMEKEIGFTEIKQAKAVI